MTEVYIWEKFNQLPAPSKEAALKFIEFLLSEAKTVANRPAKRNELKRKGFGTWNGIRLSPDFDEPLDDFSEYR